MSEWIDSPLGQLADLAIGGTPARHESKYWASDGEEGFPWVSIADLRASRVFDTSETITRAGVLNSNVKEVPSGTILMSFKLTIGEVAIAERNLFTNEAIVAVSPKSADIHARFLFHALPRAAKASVAETAIKGATLNKQKLATLRIPHHKKVDAQGKIASVLDAIDAQISATEASLAKQGRVRDGLMHDLFTRGVNENGELRPPRDEAPHLYHQTELGWLPTGWTPTPLSQLVDPARPISYGILMPGPHVPEGIPVIKVKDIRGGKILENGLRRTSRLIDAEYSRSRLRAGDILFTIRGTVGRLATVPESLAGANITQDTARLAITGCNSVFVRYFLESAAATRYIAANTLGNAVQGINLGDVKKLLIPNFEPVEQGKLVDCVLLHDTYAKEIEAELSCLKLLKNGLLQDLLTGTVSVASLLEIAPI